MSDDISLFIQKIVNKKKNRRKFWFVKSSKNEKTILYGPFSDKQEARNYGGELIKLRLMIP